LVFKKDPKIAKAEADLSTLNGETTEALINQNELPKF
jgi:hypothetical protein